MAVKKVSVDFDFDGITVRLKGAEYFYDDADIRSNIGADETDENDFTGRRVVDVKEQWSKWMVQLTAVMRSDSILTDAGQGKAKYFDFYCHPDKVGEAFEDLPGKSIDASLLPGSYQIEKVIRPRKNCYS